MDESRARLAARLARHTDRSGGPRSCWPWLASRKKDGHGQMRVAGRTLYAHRVAYELAYGPLLPGVCVLHDCPGGKDDPACCNPAHLFPGTQQDNRADCVRKNRHAKGSGNGRTKLDEAGARDVMRRLRAGEQKAAIARSLGVDPAIVRRIGNGTLWRHALAAGGAA